MHIKFDPLQCSGCHICEMICSYQHFQIFNPSKARIRVRKDISEKNGVIMQAVVCKNCEDHPCVAACPTGALFVSPKGYVALDEDRCVGCFQCVKACPYGAAFTHKDLKIPLICDLCGGDPACVKFCPRGALKVEGGE